jgi:hypothetical protein
MARAWSRRIIDGPFLIGFDRSSVQSARVVLAPAVAGCLSVGPPPVGRMPSIGVASRISRTTCPAWSSWIEALVLMI